MVVVVAMGMGMGMVKVMRPVRVVWVSLQELKNLPWIKVAGKERKERWAVILLSMAVMLATGMDVTARVHW